MQSPDRELPIFRSSGQAALLTLLMTGGDEWRSVSDAARQLGLAPSSVTREADRLAGAGLIEEQRVGNVRQIRANRRSRYFPELRDLLLKAAGPVPVLSAALRPVSGIREAYIFGSWARRLTTEGADEAPRDIDLLIVGDPDPTVIYDVAAEAEAILGQDVDPVIVTGAEWDDVPPGHRTGFLRWVRDNPLVEVVSPQP